MTDEEDTHPGQVVIHTDGVEIEERDVFHPPDCRCGGTVSRWGQRAAGELITSQCWREEIGMGKSGNPAKAARRDAAAEAAARLTDAWTAGSETDVALAVDEILADRELAADVLQLLSRTVALRLWEAEPGG